MSELNIKSLNYITSGKTEKLINVSLGSNPNMVYVANIDSSNTTMLSSLLANASSMKTKTGTIIHNLYDIKNVCIKTTIKKPTKDNVYTDTFDDFMEIYAPSLPHSQAIVNFCQLFNYSYCLTTRLSYGPNMIQTNILDNDVTVSSAIDNNAYNLKIKAEKPKTYIYSKLAEDFPSISSHFIPKYNLTDIKYNYVIEIPQANAIYNNYFSGDILGDIVVCKNEFDYSYSMDMPNTQTINSTRNYSGLGVCGDRLFLKFNDNIDYCGSDLLPVSGDIVMTSTTKPYSFQKIETIDSINRFKGNVVHKSNMFSVKIKNTNLEALNSKTSPAIKALYEQIKLDINNNVREITKKVCPVNTELFGVQIN